MLATKFFDDRYYNNEYYAKVGGITNAEVNLLERDFLQLINFRLYISPLLFFRYRERLMESFPTETMGNNWENFQIIKRKCTKYKKCIFLTKRIISIANHANNQEILRHEDTVNALSFLNPSLISFFLHIFQSVYLDSSW